MSAKVILKDKEFLVKQILSFGSVLLFYLFFPHTHELPFFELCEEV